MLREMGCDMIQGYVISKPVTVETVERTVIKSIDKKAV